MAMSININRPLKSVLLVAKNLVVRFSLQIVWNKNVTMLTSEHFTNFTVKLSEAYPSRLQ